MDDVVINGRKLSPHELHVVRIAVATYLTEIVTGERVIMVDQDLWVESLEHVTQYLYGRTGAGAEKP